MSNIQLMPTLVASSTVHSDNLEPGTKLSYEIGVSGASSLADILRVNQSLNKLSIMAYGSTPYVGMAPKKNGGDINPLYPIDNCSRHEYRYH